MNSAGKAVGKYSSPFFRCIVWVLVCLLCAPLPALAQDIVWNGPNAPGNTGELRDDPTLPDTQSLFPNTPSGNSVTVNGDIPNGHAYGGLNYHDNNTNAAANNNSMHVNGGTAYSNAYGGFAYSDSGSATATGNSVSVRGGNIGYVYGGFASSNSGSTVAKGNSVSVSGGTVEGATGGYALNISGSATATATATGNSVHVSGGTVNWNVIGGEVSNFDGAATATGNSVSVSGGTIKKNVTGGYAHSASGSATATGNSVTLSGSPVFNAASKIWGGQAVDIHNIPSGDSFTGNTLNVWNYSGSKVSSVQNFQYYNFVLPASLQAFSVGTVYFNDSQSFPVKGEQSKVTGISIMGGGKAPKAGDTLALIKAGNSVGQIANPGEILSGKKGLLLSYKFQINQVANSALTATVEGDPIFSPQGKSFSEGRVAGMAFINQGADLAAGYGLNAAQNAAQSATSAGTSGFAPFFAAQGGTSRYNTGSHVDVDGFSLMTGLAWNNQTEFGKLLLGAFFETGWGNYDSHNSFNGYASVKGDGDTKYYGGGILGRFDFLPVNFLGAPGNIYAEASLRAGWAETDFSSGDLRDPLGQKANYDSGAAYYGAHLGLGSLWNITDSSSLDLYTKYFWTHQNSDSVSVTGDPVKFKSADSHRWRGGARFSHTLTTESGRAFTPSIGAAYEHEFDGEAKASVYGHSIDSPDLAGGTGMGELGLSFKPSASSGLSLDFAVQGYTGVREGMTGSFQFKFEF